MGASHSVSATDTKIEDAMEAQLPEPEPEPEKVYEDFIDEEEMNWFWPFIWFYKLFYKIEGFRVQKLISILGNTMEFPTELQSMIQAYAKPMSRGDWRTCKRNESYAIYLLQRDKRHVVADFIGGPEFWDIVIGQSFYELLKNYPAGPPSEEGQTTIQLRRVWV